MAKKKAKRKGRPAGRVLCWVAIPGVYIGKKYVRGEVADFGHFIEVEKLAQLKRTGHLKPLDDTGLIECCPRCEARFVTRKVVDAITSYPAPPIR